MHAWEGSGLSDEKTCVMCISQCHCPRTATVLINADNQLVEHSNEKSSPRRAYSSQRGSAAFGTPCNESGDGGVACWHIRVPSSTSIKPDDFQASWIFNIQIIFVYYKMLTFKNIIQSSISPKFTPNSLHPFHRGVPLNKSDFIPVVCFTPKPCGTHFRLPHYFTYTMLFLEFPSPLNPLAIHSTQIHPQIFTPIS